MSHRVRVTSTSASNCLPLTSTSQPGKLFCGMRSAQSLCGSFPPRCGTGTGLHSGRRSRSTGSVGTGGNQSCPDGSGLGFRLTAPSQLIRIQRFLDGDFHHYHANDDYRPHNDLGSSQDTETDSQGSRARRSNGASSRWVVEPEPVMVERLKAALRQHGPWSGSLLDGATPSVPPRQRRRSLEIGDPWVPGHALSWARHRRSARREKE